MLLDESVQNDLTGAVRAAIEADADNKVTDLHIWRVGSNHWAAMVAIVTHHPRSAEHYKRLIGHLGLHM